MHGARSRDHRLQEKMGKVTTAATPARVERWASDNADR